MAPDLPPEPPISSSAAVRNKRRYNSSFYSFVLHFYVRFMNSITFYGFSVMDSHFSSCVAVIWRPLSARWGKPVFTFQRAVSSPLSGKKKNQRNHLSFCLSSSFTSLLVVQAKACRGNRNRIHQMLAWQNATCMIRVGEQEHASPDGQVCVHVCVCLAVRPASGGATGPSQCLSARI